MKTFNTLRVIFTLIGLGMLAGAFFSFQSTSTFLETATAKPGVVTDLIYSRSSDSGTYYPVVRFEDEQGRSVEFQSSSGSNPASYARGESVRVLFTPGEPESARIDGFFSLWGMALIVGGIGSVFFLVGAGLFVVPALRNGKAKKLRQSGQLVQGRYRHIQTDSIPVYIDPANPRRYWVDTSFLPKLSG